MVYDRAPMPTPRNSHFQKFINKVSNLHHTDSSPQQQIVNEVVQYGNSSDIFGKPISESPPPSIFRRTVHPCQPKNALNQNSPIQTNNFYNNMLLDDQTMPIWTQPYSLWFGIEPGFDAGLCFNHTTAQQRVFGPDTNVNPVQFYFNPPRIKSFVMSANEFQQGEPQLSLKDFEKMSVTSVLSTGNGSIEFPLVQGMGFITSVYNNLGPVIASQVGIQEFQQLNNSNQNVSKFRIKLFNQVNWFMYVSNNTSNLRFHLKDPNHIVADGVAPPNLTIQIAVGEDSSIYDQVAGKYPTKCYVSAVVNGDSCQYKFNFCTGGSSSSGKILIWTLPHQYEAMESGSRDKAVNLILDSTTKGPMRGFITNELTMNEKLPSNISFEPWSSIEGFNGVSYSQQALQNIEKAATHEIQQDVIGMSNIDSMYTSGKVLDKFAYILYTAKCILKDDNLTQQLMPKLKEAVQRFSTNNQQFPLSYDTTWKGIVSTADPGADFGNSFYNDHHFHYGYHIHACALIAKVDKDCGGNWVESVNSWVQTLIRDVANPSNKDPYFPVSRSFDFYNGHSFAHGIFASGDGKDEESSSEDYHFSYGMKLWAQVIGDSDMEARANLQLAIMRRAMNMYMLYSNDNKIQPPNFIGNKVAGITFENKIDFSTYFGRGAIGNEWIHGIHMLPITPISSFIRKPKFVEEEWNEKLAPIINQINDGWKGILILNSGLFNPKYAYQFFIQPNFQSHLLDNGMSLTWSLAYTAGVGGC